MHVVIDPRLAFACYQTLYAVVTDVPTLQALTLPVDIVGVVASVDGNGRLRIVSKHHDYSSLIRAYRHLQSSLPQRTTLLCNVALPCCLTLQDVMPA